MSDPASSTLQRTVTVLPMLTESGTAMCKLSFCLPTGIPAPPCEEFWALGPVLYKSLNQAQTEEFKQAITRDDTDDAQEILVREFAASFRATRPDDIPAGWNFNLCKSAREFEDFCHSGTEYNGTVLPPEFIAVSPKITDGTPLPICGWDEIHYLEPGNWLDTETEQTVRDAYKDISLQMRSQFQRATISHDIDALRSLLYAHLMSATVQLKTYGIIPRVETEVYDDEQTVTNLKAFYGLTGAKIPDEHPILPERFSSSMSSPYHIWPLTTRYLSITEGLPWARSSLV